MPKSLRFEIFLQHQRLIEKILPMSAEYFFEKQYFLSGVKVSAADVIAYQVGWGELLVCWYQKGKLGAEFIMPGDGFDKWDYKNISLHFYKKYSPLSKEGLINKFNIVVKNILEIVDTELLLENLDKLGVFNWCKLKNGKDWPLEKWIQVNTVGPYKRAIKVLTKVKA